MGISLERRSIMFLNKHLNIRKYFNQPLYNSVIETIFSRNGQKKCEPIRDSNLKIRDIKKNGHRYEKYDISFFFFFQSDYI